ncbi:hypothetical protein NA78x_002725 [Anatilimnocola sp. NA78]|uniref:hypothetical protein n=1 Tax=Anatilimnocola sp. NA78 TaxID=3415683 RepID=UPI003CE47395
MYKGFDLRGFSERFIKPQFRNSLREHGRAVTASNHDDVRRRLAAIATENAVLNGAEIQDSWFPQVNADVFLSHSHRNEDLVLMLAGWLHDRFGLKAFIDSSIWGYAGELLQIIDKAYCWQPESKTYNYQLRNESTSHVHMMLTTALGMMIHRTECLIFVNTPDSIEAERVIKSQTYSPWIYVELTIAGIVGEVEPKRLKEKRAMLKAAASRELLERRKLQVLHTIEHLDRLRPIEKETLLTWAKDCKTKGVDALDMLYEVAAW